MEEEKDKNEDKNKSTSLTGNNKHVEKLIKKTIPLVNERNN